MNELAGPLLHAIGVCLPFGVAFGAFAAPVRFAGVDFRQWFRDPAQPSAHADDSWVGLLKSDMWSVFIGFVAAVLALGLWLAWPVLAEWKSCCVLPRVWAAVLYLLPYFVGFALGVVVAQGIAECLWRFGLAVAPDALPASRLLSPQVVSSRLPAPAPRARRRLIVCCDGTWNWPDRKRETNVIRLARAITPEAPNGNGAPIPQISHYHLGVGTGNVLDRVIGGGLGVGLSNSVKACYGFLVDNYMPGDEIFLFGFSRGAYVARSVAGLVGCVGMLRHSEMERFIEVWDWYTEDRDKRQPGTLDGIAPARRHPVDIECIGVWDTVGSLGIPGTRVCAGAFAFHETELGPRVKHAFQALAIDEQRGNFQAAIWTPHPAPAVPQVLEQMWFPGVHSNIGGGYERHGLSDTALLWMVSRITASGLLELDMDYIASALDRTRAYPTGILEPSRTLWWRIIGSPIPRPVGLTSDSERIHESAWARAVSNIARDAYAESKRRQWLQAHEALVCRRSALEIALAVDVAEAPAGTPPPRLSRRIGVCDRLLTLLGGNA